MSNHTSFTLSDITVGDNVEAFHPHMFGVIKHGRVVKVGRKFAHVDFGTTLGGVCRVAPRDITENWGEG